MEIRIKDKRGGRFIVDDVVLNGYGKALGPYGIAFYITLCRHANMQSQQCWPSQQMIADKTGMSVRQVKNMADRCEELGLVSREIAEGKYTVYTLLEPKYKHLEENEELLHDMHSCTTDTPPLHTMQGTPAPGADKGTNKGTKEGTKDISTVEKISHKKFSSIDDICVEDCQEISEKYHVPVGFVQLQLEKMRNWCDAKGKKYKNYRQALANWVLMDAQRQVERRNNDPKSGIDARGV